MKVLFICLIFRLTFAGLWSLSVCKSSNLKQRALCREPTDPRGGEILSPPLHATFSPGGCGLQRAPQSLARSGTRPPPALAFPRHRPPLLLPPGAEQSPAGGKPSSNMCHSHRGCTESYEPSFSALLPSLFKTPWFAVLFFLKKSPFGRWSCDRDGTGTTFCFPEENYRWFLPSISTASA